MWWGSFVPVIKFLSFSSLLSLKFLKVINTSLTYKHAFYWNLLIITIEAKHVQCFFSRFQDPPRFVDEQYFFIVDAVSLSYYITYFYYFLIIFDHNGNMPQVVWKILPFLLISISPSSIYSKKKKILNWYGLYSQLYILLFLFINPIEHRLNNMLNYS